MENIEKNIQLTLRQIYAAEQKFHRQSGSVRLLAVSKTHSVKTIEEAISAGLRDFGENYLQEALPKIKALSQYQPSWYFIGPVQSNKTRQIAENFDWVLSANSEKTVKRLSDARPHELGPINLCIQVNVSGEISKSGIAPSGVYQLASCIMDQPRLKLRGIMGIPAPTTELNQQRSSFRQLREIYEDIIDRGFELDTLSMGMSNDMDTAISEGSTMVRIGTAIFGERTK